MAETTQTVEIGHSELLGSMAQEFDEFKSGLKVVVGTRLEPESGVRTEISETESFVVAAERVRMGDSSAVAECIAISNMLKPYEYYDYLLGLFETECFTDFLCERVCWIMDDPTIKMMPEYSRHHCIRNRLIHEFPFLKWDKEGKDFGVLILYKAAESLYRRAIDSPDDGHDYLRAGNEFLTLSLSLLYRVMYTSQFSGDPESYRNQIGEDIIMNVADLDRYMQLHGRSVFEIYPSLDDELIVVQQLMTHDGFRTQNGVLLSAVIERPVFDDETEVYDTLTPILERVEGRVGQNYAYVYYLFQHLVDSEWGETLRTEFIERVQACIDILRWRPEVVFDVEERAKATGEVPAEAINWDAFFEWLDKRAYSGTLDIYSQASALAIERGNDAVFQGLIERLERLENECADQPEIIPDIKNTRCKVLCDQVEYKKSQGEIVITGLLNKAANVGWESAGASVRCINYPSAHVLLTAAKCDSFSWVFRGVGKEVASSKKAVRTIERFDEFLDGDRPRITPDSDDRDNLLADLALQTVIHGHYGDTRTFLDGIRKPAILARAYVACMLELRKLEEVEEADV